MRGLLPSSLQAAWCPCGLLGEGVGCDTQPTRRQALALWILWADGEMDSVVNIHALTRQGNPGCGITVWNNSAFWGVGLGGGYLL